MPRWYDDGVRIKAYVSNSGDYVSLGKRTEYPFVAGGAGIPADWHAVYNPPAVAADVNWTTQDGRFSISNASATNSHNALYYGIYRDFPVTYGKAYIINVQARTMQGKWKVSRWLRYFWNGSIDAFGQRKDTEQDWEQLSLYAVPPLAASSIRIYLWINYYLYPGEVENFAWGGQWQSVALTELDLTYPDPTWHEVTCESNALDITYGRSRFTGRYDVASAALTVLNDSGQYVYRASHPWGLRPGRFIWILLFAPDGTQWYAFYGIIDNITDTFTLDGRAAARIDAIDTSSLLSNTDVPSVSGDNTTYYSGGRFGALIDAIGWHPTKRNISPGVYVQQGIYASGRSVRDELGLIADSEGGHFWTDRNGNLTYKDRNYYLNTPSANTVQAELIAECPDYVDEVLFKLPGLVGNGMSAVYQAAFAFPNGMDIRAKVTFDNIVGPTDDTIASQNGCWNFVRAAGFRQLGFNGYYANNVLPFNSGETFWVRAKYLVSSGVVNLYYGRDNGNLDGPASWTSLGTKLVGAIPTGPQPVIFGATNSAMTTPLKGTLYRCDILDSVNLGSAIVLNPRDIPGSMGQTSFRLTDGNTVTVSQTGTNVIIQKDPKVTPYRLTAIDHVPNAIGQVVQELRAFESDWSRDRVINDIRVANQNGAALQVVDIDSQKAYGPRTYQRLDYLNDNTHPEYLTQRSNDLMNGWTVAKLRVNRVVFVPTPITYKWAMSMWLGDLVRMRYQHPTEGWNFAIVSHIQGFTHSLNMNGWTVGVNLDQPESFVYYDRPPSELTGWDIDYWDQGIWDNADPNAAYWTSGQVWTDPASKWSE